MTEIVQFMGLGLFASIISRFIKAATTHKQNPSRLKSFIFPQDIEETTDRTFSDKVL